MNTGRDLEIDGMHGEGKGISSADVEQSILFLQGTLLNKEMKWCFFVH